MDEFKSKNLTSSMQDKRGVSSLVLGILKLIDWLLVQELLTWFSNEIKVE